MFSEYLILYCWPTGVRRQNRNFLHSFWITSQLYYRTSCGAARLPVITAVRRISLKCIWMLYRYLRSSLQIFVTIDFRCISNIFFLSSVWMLFCSGQKHSALLWWLTFRDFAVINSTVLSRGKFDISDSDFLAQAHNQLLLQYCAKDRDRLFVNLSCRHDNKSKI